MGHLMIITYGAEVGSWMIKHKASFITFLIMDLRLAVEVGWFVSVWLVG